MYLDTYRIVMTLSRCSSYREKKLKTYIANLINDDENILWVDKDYSK